MALLAVEITAATDASGTTTTLRYADQAYIHPDAPAPFDERIVSDQTLEIRREIQSAAPGSVQVSFSDLVLMNADGGLDALADYGFDGRQIVGYILPGSASPWADRKTLFTATMGTASLDLETVSIPIRDRLAELDQPLHNQTYSGSGDLEGSTDTIAGRPKPEPDGLNFNVSPPLVNSSKLIYEFSNNRDTTGIADAVYEGGISIPEGAKYSDETDLLNNAPASGEFRQLTLDSLRDGGYIRLGSTPQYTVTCDTTNGAADSEPAEILRRLATRAPTLSSSDVNSTDVSDLNSTLPDAIGVWQPQEAQILSVMQQLAGSCNIWFGFDRIGELRLGLWDTPASPVATFRQADPSGGTVLADGEYDVLSFEGEPTNRGDLPVYDVTVKYKRNHTVQGDLDTNITTSRRAFIENEWRRVTATDSSVQDKHQNAQQMSVDSLWADSTGAQDAADRRLARDKVLRRRWRLQVSDLYMMADVVDIGDTITVDLPRYDLDGGKDHRVYAIRYDIGQDIVEYGVWG